MSWLAGYREALRAEGAGMPPPAESVLLKTLDAIVKELELLRTAVEKVEHETAPDPEPVVRVEGGELKTKRGRR